MAAAAGTLSPAPKFTGLDDAGNPIAGGKLSTYYAGTSTPAPTYSDADLDVSHVNTNPVILDTAARAIVFLNPGVSYKFILKTAADVVVWSQDNIAAVSPLQTGIDTIATVGEDIAAGQAAYMSSGAGGKIAGRWYRGDTANTYSSTDPAVVGLALAPILLGQSGSIRVVGAVTGLSGLVPGAKYYIGALGALTVTKPVNARTIGQADTTTSLVMTPSAPAATAGLVVAINPATGAIALDASLGTVFFLYATGDCTIGVPTNAIDGQKIIIRFVAVGGPRTLTLTNWAGGGAPGAFRFCPAIPTPLTQTPINTTDYVGCCFFSSFVAWDVVAYVKGF